MNDLATSCLADGANSRRFSVYTLAAFTAQISEDTYASGECGVSGMLPIISGVAQDFICVSGMRYQVEGTDIKSVHLVHPDPLG